MSSDFVRSDSYSTGHPAYYDPVMILKWKTYLPELVFILITLAAGGLSAIAVMKGMPFYEQLAKPPLTPPSAVFPIVWSILYLLMGIGAARVWKAHAPRRGTAIAVFGVQLVMNALWSVWFFALQALLFAFVWLIALILAIALMIRVFSGIDRPAAWMQVPYLLWCCFAAYLNFGIWILNR